MRGTRYQELSILPEEDYEFLHRVLLQHFETVPTDMEGDSVHTFVAWMRKVVNSHIISAEELTDRHLEMLICLDFNLLRILIMMYHIRDICSAYANKGIMTSDLFCDDDLSITDFFFPEIPRDSSRSFSLMMNNEVNPSTLIQLKRNNNDVIREKSREHKYKFTIFSNHQEQMVKYGTLLIMDQLVKNIQGLCDFRKEKLLRDNSQNTYSRTLIEEYGDGVLYDTQDKYSRWLEIFEDDKESLENKEFLYETFLSTSLCEVSGQRHLSKGRAKFVGTYPKKGNPPLQFSMVVPNDIAYCGEDYVICLIPKTKEHHNMDFLKPGECGINFRPFDEDGLVIHRLKNPIPEVLFD